MQIIEWWTLTIIGADFVNIEYDTCIRTVLHINFGSEIEVEKLIINAKKKVVNKKWCFE